MDNKPHWKPILDWRRSVTYGEWAIDAIGVLFFALGVGLLFVSFNDYSLALGSDEYVPWLQQATGLFPDMEGVSFVVSQMFTGVLCFIISVLVLKRTRILQG
jgi:hypothetical protein